MLVANEKLAPPVGVWVRYLGTLVFLAGIFATLILHGSTLYDFCPHELVVLPVSWLLAVPFILVYRRGGLGHHARLRRLSRRSADEITGTLRPFPGDPLAHTAPIATQRPRKDQPGYRALAARPFDLELEDGRRVRVEPHVAILDAQAETIPYGTRVTLSGQAFEPATYREADTALRGTEERPLVIRVERAPRAELTMAPAE